LEVGFIFNQNMEELDGGWTDLPPTLRNAILKIIEKGVESGIASYEKTRREHEVGPFIGVEVNSNNDTPLSSQSSLTTTPSSYTSVSTSERACNAKVLKVNTTLQRNKRKIEQWRNKTLADVFPVLNDESRLFMAIESEDADFLSDIRSTQHIIP
jgi:hypothetical protein